MLAKKTVLIAGASGFIGGALTLFLKQHGYKVLKLVRDPAKVDLDAFFWNPEKGEMDLSAFKKVDVVINLSGENISDRRWTALRKREILESRLQATHTLVHAFSELRNPPGLFINASAVGIYGDCGDAICNEQSPIGSGFLSDVCREWESAAKLAASKGIRTLIFRFGVVLSPRGGLLKKMLSIFKWGLGGRLGSGKQYMSWIALDDLLSIFLFALTHESIDQGVVNLVSPHPVTNEEFTQVLGRMLHRPTWLSVPSFVLRILLGREMADGLVLSSTRVEPLRLTSAGYKFLYPSLEAAFRHFL